MKKWLVLFLIIAVAVIFRFYKLGSVPPSPDWDEAALGYNAYSIFKTGRDEYGNFLPLSIRSFDDYKPPLYTYLTVPSVGLFGLNTWSTRLPSAVMGILAVIGTYFLVRELCNMGQGTMSRRQKAGDNEQGTGYETKDNEQGTKDVGCSLSYVQSISHAHCPMSLEFLPLLSAFLLAISPWHIQFSRIAFEANTGLTVNIWAITVFFVALRKRGYFPLAAFLFGLGMYAYHSERVFLPLILLSLVIIFRKNLFRKEAKRMIVTAVIIGIVTVLPLVTVLFDKSAMLRLRGTSSFTDQTGLLERSIIKLEDDKNRHDTLGELLDNRRLVYAKTIAAGYLSHFSLKWLFLTGDNPRHHAPDMGLLYLWELPFLLVGMYMVARYGGRVGAFLYSWVLIAPVAASVTTGLPHAIRTLVFLPTFQIFTAVGIVTIVLSIKYQVSGIKRISARCSLLTVPCPLFIVYCLLFLVLCFSLCNVGYYAGQYFIAMNKEYSRYWQYGYEEAVNYTESFKDKYEKVVVSTGLEQSYMFFLFYTKFDPVAYLKNGGTKSGGFAEDRNAFDKYIFRPLDWNNESFDGKTLYVGSSGEIPHGNNAHIPFLDGTPAIEIKDRKD